MKISGRLQAVIDLVEQVSTTHRPMDGTAADYFRNRRYIGSKDRAEIAERLYRILRHWARLNWWVQKEELPETARSLVLVDAVIAGAASLNELKNLFSGAKHAPDELSGAELKAACSLQGQTMIHPDMPENVQVECPDWAETRLKDRFGSAFREAAAAMLEPAPMDLRVNTLKVADRETARERLAGQGVETDPTPYSPWGLRCRKKVFLSVTKAFARGLVDIQDEGSQLIALICHPAPGHQVLDYCAGAGGKSLALAAMMQGKGRIMAMDVLEGRLERAKRRFRKAGAHNIETRAIEDHAGPNKKWLKRHRGYFDIVLTDVPCSGTGTWRRNPDMRWRWYGPALDELKALQAEILERAAQYVKPGGALIYATCSLLPEENEDQVEAFLHNHPDFGLEPLSEAWPLPGAAPCAGPYMQLSPHEHGTDGFFAARLRKVS